MELSNDYKGGSKYERSCKGMLLVLIILYVFSPIDLCPGPIDDIIVILLGVAAQKGIGKSEVEEV